jgi:RNA methyltransferase, TrmH family
MKRMAEIRPGRAVAAPHLSESIESRENRWLKRFRAALSGDARRHNEDESEGIAGVEGARLVETALRSGVEILAVLFSETGERHIPRLQQWIPAEARLLRSNDRLFAFASGTETPQGIAALVRPRAAAFDDLITGLPLILVMAGVQDPGNVGTLVRTAEALGANGICVCAAGDIGTANPFSPKALRSSAGAALRLPIIRGIAAPVLLAQLRIAGIQVYAACPDEIVDSAASGSARKPLAPWEIDWRQPVALLVGNEGAGLPGDLVRSAGGIVRIPHAAHPSAANQEDSPAESLNAAVAGSILLYEAARQRGLC